METDFELSKDTVGRPEAALVRAEKMKTLNLDPPIAATRRQGDVPS
jgi:hypothetical protein